MLRATDEPTPGIESTSQHTLYNIRTPQETQIIAQHTRIQLCLYTARQHAQQDVNLKTRPNLGGFVPTGSTIKRSR